MKLSCKSDEDVSSLAIVSKRIEENDPILASEERDPNITALMELLLSVGSISC